MKIDESSPRVREALSTITGAVTAGRTVSLVTWTLSDYGEFLLHHIASAVLVRFGRPELLDIVYPAAKELIINATKANMKRVFFDEQGIDALIPSEYDRGMALFREQLTEHMMQHHRRSFVDRGYRITATFYYTSKVLNIKVKNNYPLLPREEQRIREKFQRAESFTSLLDFYMAHADDTEGAGLGITMVGLLLDESGIDRHGFTVFVKPGYSETAARLEIPLSADYIPRRKQFEREMQRTGLSAEELRPRFRPVIFDDE